jgi:hypothetical protein
LFFREVTFMDPQASDGPNQRQAPDGKHADGEELENIVWGTSDRAQRPQAPLAATSPARRPDARLTQDGQLAEAGYGHGV